MAGDRVDYKWHARLLPQVQGCRENGLPDVSFNAGGWSHSGQNAQSTTALPRWRRAISRHEAGLRGAEPDQVEPCTRRSDEDANEGAWKSHSVAQPSPGGV